MTRTGTYSSVIDATKEYVFCAFLSASNNLRTTLLRVLKFPEIILSPNEM